MVKLYVLRAMALGIGLTSLGLENAVVANQIKPDHQAATAWIVDAATDAGLALSEMTPFEADRLIVSFSGPDCTFRAASVNPMYADDVAFRRATPNAVRYVYLLDGTLYAGEPPTLAFVVRYTQAKLGALLGYPRPTQSLVAIAEYGRCQAPFPLNTRS